MEGFTFITEKFNKKEDAYELLGTIRGELPKEGARLEVLCFGGRKYSATVVNSEYTTDTEIKHVANEKVATIVVKYDEASANPAVFDVVTDIMVDPEADPKVTPDSRRVNALIWKYRYLNRENIQAALLEEIAMNARFYTVVEEIGSESEQKGIKFPTIQASNKHRFYAAFTTKEDLEKAPKLPSSRVIIINFDDYVALLHRDVYANGIVINPFTTNMRIDRKTMGFLKKQKAKIVGAATEDKKE